MREIAYRPVHLDPRDLVCVRIHRIQASSIARRHQRLEDSPAETARVAGHADDCHGFGVKQRANGGGGG
jgi:hypothetical protein